MNNNLQSQQNHNGYMIIKLQSVHGVHITISVHRLVAMAFLNNQMYNKNPVNHIDGVKHNNFEDNLEFCTYSENSKHALRIGLNNAYGEQHCNSIITNEEVHIICDLLSKNIDRETIISIINKNNIYDNNSLSKLIYRIHTKKDWNFISDLYIFSYINTSGNSRKFLDEQVHTICLLIQQGILNYDYILNYIGIDIILLDTSVRNDMRKTVKCIMYRKYYKEISLQYIFNSERIISESFLHNELPIVYNCIQNNMSFEQTLEYLGLSKIHLRRTQYINYNNHYNTLFKERSTTIENLE